MKQDKKLHLICGLAIAIVFGWQYPLIGLLAGVIAGIGKEVYDYFDYGLFDKKDMLFTWLGATIGALVSVLYKMLI